MRVIRKVTRQIQIVVALSFAILGTAKAADPERTFSHLDRELEYLMQIWPGDYNNQEQIRFEADWNIEESAVNRRIHSSIRRIDLAAFGEYALYVEDWWDDEDEAPFRQRIYALSTDEDAGAIRVRFFYFNDGAEYIGAGNNPVLLDKLAIEDTVSLPRCDVLMRRDVDGFVGGMQEKACHFGEGEEHRYTEWEMRVDSDSYWFRDRERDYETDEVIMSLADYTWHKLERANWYACMVDFPREPGGLPVETGHYVQLHDQGGEFSFTHPDGRLMTMLMRNFWSYEMYRETLTVAVIGGEAPGPTLVYGWGTPGSDRIGVNPGWIRVQCDRDSPRIRQLQQELRPDS